MSLLDVAAANREAQKNLLDAIDDAASTLGYEHVAERLDITVEELMLTLDGQRDLTMTELRLLAIAANVVISYDLTQPDAATPTVASSWRQTAAQILADMAGMSTTSSERPASAEAASHA